jgi:hypothetical protein
MFLMRIYSGLSLALVFLPRKLQKAILLFGVPVTLWFGTSPACRAAQPHRDYLVPVTKPLGSRAAYEELWKQKLLVTPGEIARFVGLPGTGGVETTVSVYRAPGKEGSLPGDYWMTATQASESLWNCVEPGTKGQVDPNAIAVERCDAAIPESTALTVHKSWLTMLSQSRPQHDSRVIPVDSSREIFSAVDAEGRILQGESPTAPKINTNALINIALSLLEYCGADASSRATIATDIEKAASNLLDRVASSSENLFDVRNPQTAYNQMRKSDAARTLPPTVWPLALISNATGRLPRASARGEFTPVRILGKEGVIVPQVYLRASGLPAEGFWTPATSQLREVERSLPTFLRKEMQTRPLGELSEVIALAPKYRRQYVGMISNGRKIIWINCIPQKSEKGVDPFANWNREIIDVSDGGSSFWGVTYDLERHSFDRLILNGSG